MGVLGLFSYLSRSYKKAFSPSRVPIIESVYLDGNALLYPIAEVTKDPAEIAASMLQVASSYGERYQCRCHIYIDGAAHMGKIRQQRMRRFLYDPVSSSTPHTDVGTREGTISVHDAPRWSPAMFSPGTDMMQRIHAYIQEHIHEYNNVSIYSSYMEHGEGEHKIIRHIRDEASRRSPDEPYRTAIVGKDADLLLMAMGTCPQEGHNSYIYVLRHNDRYDGNPDGYRPTDPIYCVDTPLLRDAIIASYKHKGITSIWNFIIASFLLGNDFLPPVPELIDINTSIPMILASKHILYREDTGINWEGLISLIKSMHVDRRNVYKRWIQGDTRNVGEDAFSSMYYFHMSRFPPYVEGMILSWLTTLQWVFVYYHDGMDAASIAWQYPLSYSPSLYTLKGMDASTIDASAILSTATKEVSPLSPVQALCGVLPMWLHDLLPEDYRDKISMYREYYPISFDIIDPTGDPIIPPIPYEVLSSL